MAVSKSHWKTAIFSYLVSYIFGDWILHNKPDKRRARNKWYCAEILRRLYICRSFKNTRKIPLHIRSIYREKPSSAFLNILLTSPNIIVSPGFALFSSLVIKSGNCQKWKNMIKYRWRTIVLQGGSLPKLHARFAGVHKRGGGANDSFWNHFDFHRYIGFADCLW